MLFNSLDFAVFLPLVFLIYWAIGGENKFWQNSLILVSSYFFYGQWSYIFLSLIAISTTSDFVLGMRIHAAEKKKEKRLWLTASLLINLGILGYFKYANFFIENFDSAFSFFGYDLNLGTLEIVLPVGISFYTFQTMSYSIDIYRNKLKPSSNIIEFASFVSFFPQLVAGPIERATNLLPQFQNNRHFNYSQAIDGCRLILWGMFKKVVIADNCATLVNLIFNGSHDYGGATLFLGGVLFAFQIYGDFSGYSDMAIGTAKLFGINLMKNFAYPYFSRDIAEFWRRWHISLSTWFRDYLYIPLGGSKGGKWSSLRNIFIIFIVSGFWHGSNWTFIIWGALNAVYFVPLFILNLNRRNLNTVAEKSFLPNFKELIQMGLTFCLTVIAWIFFRADNITEAIYIISKIFSPQILEIDYHIIVKSGQVIVLICLQVALEWIGRKKDFPLQILPKNKFLRFLYYALLVAIIGFFTNKENTPFIYFQF